MAALSKNCGFIYRIYLCASYAQYKCHKSISIYLVLISKNSANKILFFTGFFSVVKKGVLNFSAATKKHQLIFMQKMLNRHKNGILKTLKTIVYMPYKRKTIVKKDYFLCFF